jgi:IS5 family transposase
MASGLFTLAQLARAVGMSVNDVRFYRDSGLLQAPQRQRSRSDDLTWERCTSANEATSHER